jgi:hypothetical protein
MMDDQAGVAVGSGDTASDTAAGLKVLAYTDFAGLGQA